MLANANYSPALDWPGRQFGHFEKHIAVLLDQRLQEGLLVLYQTSVFPCMEMPLFPMIATPLAIHSASRLANLPRQSGSPSVHSR